MTAGCSDKGPDIDVLSHLNAKMRRAGWQPPPFFSFDQHRRRTAYEHRRDITLSPYCNIRRAPFQGNRTARGCSGTCRKNDQIAASANCRNAVVNKLDAIVIIANIGRGMDRGMSERVAPKLALDDADSALNESDEKHNIDERRMVGKNQQSVTLQPFQPADFISEHAHQAHQANDTAESKPDHMASDDRPPLSASNDDIEQRKYENSANADRNETQPGTEHAPTTDKPIKHDRTTATDVYRIFARELDPCVSRNAAPPTPPATPPNLEDGASEHLTTSAR